MLNQDLSYSSRIRRETQESLAVVSEEQLERICMGTTAAWTRQNVYYVAKQYMSKVSTDRIAKEIGVSPTSVLRVLRILGIPIRRSGSMPTISDEQAQHVALMLREHTQREVAETLGLSRHVVQRIAAQERNRAQAC